MSEAVPGGWHWRVSCALNAATGGDRRQPMCARAWDHQWPLFIEAMAVAFRDPTHCERIHERWRKLG